MPSTPSPTTGAAPRQKTQADAPKSATKSAAHARPIRGQVVAPAARPAAPARAVPGTKRVATRASAQATAKSGRASPKSAPVARLDAPRARPAAPADSERKPKKPKLVRDSYTIPKNEYQDLASLKERLVALGRPVKKSELLRAGIHLLRGLADAVLLQALAQVPALKTGRPKKGSLLD